MTLLSSKECPISFKCKWTAETDCDILVELFVSQWQICAFLTTLNYEWTSSSPSVLLGLSCKGMGFSCDKRNNNALPFFDIFLFVCYGSVWGQGPVWVTTGFKCFPDWFLFFSFPFVLVGMFTTWWGSDNPQLVLQWVVIISRTSKNSLEVNIP